jgi:hypothetical protein
MYGTIRKMTRIHTVLIILIIVFLLLTSCGKTSYGEDKMIQYDNAVSSSAGGMALRTAAAESMPAPKQSADSSLMLEEGRKKVITANIELEVKDLAGAEQALQNLTASYNGWIDRSSTWETSLSLTLRVPADQLEPFLQEAGSLGKVISKSLSADDVTDYYTDTQARLETLTILKERYTDYLKKAETMEDILSIERELNSTIAEIESMERTMRRLDGQITYATIYVNGYLPSDKQVSGNLPNILEGLKKLGYGFINLLYFIGIGLLYTVIFGIPIILTAGLIYLIGWGRVGLIRKFFRLLTRKKEKPQKNENDQRKQSGQESGPVSGKDKT